MTTEQEIKQTLLAVVVEIKLFPVEKQTKSKYSNLTRMK